MNYLYGWLSINPPILVHSSHDDDIGRHLPEEPMIRFVQYMWHSTADEITRRHQQAHALRPAHALHHLVNDPTVCRQLVARGISAWFVNHNAFVDERQFDIQPDVKKLFDAAYNARMARFKRHRLADKIEKLLIIGGVFAGDDRTDYFDELIASMPNATFTHQHDREFRLSDEVAILLNQSRVGLCLSACEGAMYSTTEYLLCGLPIVSTVSQGGRDVWFDPRFTRIVPDQPEAVASAVAELVSLNIPAPFIRGETLSRIWEHRNRFIDLGQSIYAGLQVGRDFARDFYSNFTDKLAAWRDPADVMVWFERKLRQ